MEKERRGLIFFASGIMVIFICVIILPSSQSCAQFTYNLYNPSVAMPNISIVPMSYTYLLNPYQSGVNSNPSNYLGIFSGGINPLFGAFMNALYQPSYQSYQSEITNNTQNIYQATAYNTYQPQQSQLNSSQGGLNSTINLTNNLYIPNSLSGQSISIVPNIANFINAYFPGLNPLSSLINLNLMPWNINPQITNPFVVNQPTVNINNNPLTATLYQTNAAYYPYPQTNQGIINLNPTAMLPSLINTNNYYAAGLDILAGQLYTVEVPPAALVLANPEYGMYCFDPSTWLNNGYAVGIWCTKIPIRAQSLDKRGRLLDDVPTYSVNPTGETGVMTLYDSSISLFRVPIDASSPADYLVTVTVDSVSTVATAKRRNATCDSCHQSPPGHIAVSLTWGKCHDCHNLGDKLHKHAYNAGIAIDNCYRCHPSGCLSGAHGQLGIWCTPCHGTLEDAINDSMKISGQLGKPLCADCHDQDHSEPAGALFYESAGHGGVWCINCHDATHVELSQPLGLNDCKLCHTVQPNIPWMGPNCALCHESSYSPHYVN